MLAHGRFRHKLLLLVHTTHQPDLLNTNTPMSLKSLPADARPREKLITHGAGSLADVELLAVLLRTGTKGRSVLTMAQELLSQFGGLAGLLNTSSEELKQFKGLGGTAKRAELIAVLELARRALAQKLKAMPVFTSLQAVIDYLQLQLGALQHEVFAVLFLDTQHHLIEMKKLFYGTLTHSSIYPREVVIAALMHNAHAVILAHNHPSGQTAPSSADKQVTQALTKALALVDIHVLDHIIVGKGQSTSMAEQGLL